MVFEGIGVDILPSSILDSPSQVIPHWVFIFLIFIVIFYEKENTYFSVLYSVIFGLLIDIIYTNILGVYMFSYAIVIYMIHILKRFFHENFSVTVLLGIIGILLADLTINIIYAFIGIASFDWADYFYYRLLPTVLANLVFLILFYPIFKRRLMKWKKEQ